MDTVLSVYSGQGVRFDALGVIIIQLLAEHESHGRPILDAGLLEQFLRGFKIPFPFDLKTSYTGIILFDKFLRYLTRLHNYLRLLHHKICQEGFFSQYPKGCLLGKTDNMSQHIVLLCRVEKQAGGGGRGLMLVSGKKGSARHIRDGSWEGDCALHICTNSLFTHSPCCHPSLGEHLHICTFAQPLFSPCCHPHVLCLCSAHLRHLSSHLVTLLEQ